MFVEIAADPLWFRALFVLWFLFILMAVWAVPTRDAARLLRGTAMTTSVLRSSRLSRSCAHSTFIKDARSRARGPKCLLAAARFLGHGVGSSCKARRESDSLPRWRVTRWLADCGPGVPDDIRVELIGNLFGNLPVFVGGVINTVAVAIAIVARKPTAPFIAWLVFEIAVCTARLIVLLVARRAALSRAETPTDIYLILGLAWSASVGYGVIVSLASGDFVIATLACLSSAAMVGGICFRNFSAPRFAAAMILISLGSSVPGALLSGQSLLYVVLLQAPLYFTAMTSAAFTLNRMSARITAGRSTTRLPDCSIAKD